MKKLLILVTILLLCVPVAEAQQRGALTNVYASWANVTNESVVTFSWGHDSRDVLIINGDATSADGICVNLKGTDIGDDSDYAGGGCDTDNGLDTATKLMGGDELYLSDFISSGISVKAIGQDASPVSVVVTY